MKPYMNLYIEDMANYLLQRWQNIQQEQNGVHEARFVIESLPPEHTFALLSRLEHYKNQVTQQSKVECYFKVANGLWQAWQRQSGYNRDQLIALLKTYGGEINEQGELNWIDEEDRLTWYRNRTKQAQDDALVVILIGLDHTSDQGGLADFHAINEEVLWQQMQQHYRPWLERLAERLNLDDQAQLDKQLDHLDSALQELFKLKPRRLLRLAEFFSKYEQTTAPAFADMHELLLDFYQHLPFWDIPPLFAPTDFEGSATKLANKLKILIKPAADFIDHQRLNTKAEQKKALERIDKLLEDERANTEEESENKQKIFELPATLEADLAYQDKTDYYDTLLAFIRNCDAESRQRLLWTDAYALAEALKTKSKSRVVKTEKITRLQGLSVDVFLNAIFLSIQNFVTFCEDNNDSWEEELASIHIELEKFHHDLEHNDGIDASLLARDLLKGCLGGLDDLLVNLAIRLPQDESELAKSTQQWSNCPSLNFNLIPKESSCYRRCTSSKRPYIEFKVTISNQSRKVTSQGKVKSEVNSHFQWVIDTTHMERVRLQWARTLVDLYSTANVGISLPMFTLDDDTMTALYYAADEEEANRLMSHALSMVKMVNILQGLDLHNSAVLDNALVEQINQLAQLYYQWLKIYITEGYFKANLNYSSKVIYAYENLAKSILEESKQGNSDLLSRFYKAFLLVKEGTAVTHKFLPSAIAIGITPAVMEMMCAREYFLRDHFTEVVAEYVLGYRNDEKTKGKRAWERLLHLVSLQRPLAVLVVDENSRLSARNKGFNLIHYLGDQPSGEKSLAVQTMLREDDDVTEDLKIIKQFSVEGKILSKVLNLYQELFAFSEDGLRILAVHVKNLPLLLNGIDCFLSQYLELKAKESKAYKTSYWPAYFCELTVYSTSSSPLAIEKKLILWRDEIVERFHEQGRGLNLVISHRFAPTRQDIISLLNQETRVYDIAFLCRFLEEAIKGKIEETQPSSLNEEDLGKFPISEHPRPIKQTEPYERLSLLSNRRLRVQSVHADLSARLRYPYSHNNEHLILGTVDFSPWRDVIQTLHQKAQWVACIDPFIDKHLLTYNSNSAIRKIVGFESGLGAYGEINLAISTEQDTLEYLAQKVCEQIGDILIFARCKDIKMAASIVEQAENIIGLASLRAIAGKTERIREVVGFAAVQRLLAIPEQAVITQLLPLDSFSHWLREGPRPDLLQLALVLAENKRPLIKATLIECKLAKHAERHIDKALEQVKAGLAHFTQRFAPYQANYAGLRYDQRYWWAQLHRALTSRAVLGLTMDKESKLNNALEKIIAGDYDITWQAAIFTFWTDLADEPFTVANYPMTKQEQIIVEPFSLPEGFNIYHTQLGYEGLLALFANTTSSAAWQVPLPAIGINSVKADDLKTDNTDIAVMQFTVSKDKHETIKTEPLSLIPIESFTDKQFSIPPTAVEKQIVDSPVPTHENAVIANTINIAKNYIKPEPYTETTVEAFSPALGNMPAKVFLGYDPKGKPVYWYYGHEKLANRHLLVLGNSGFGKTYAIQCLLAELAEQSLHSIIIDYTDGFLPTHLETIFKACVNPLSHFIIYDKLPLNPFRKQMRVIDPAMPAYEESALAVASRITSIFTSVFNTMGDQQASVLSKVLEAGISQQANFSLDGILALLEAEGTIGKSLANKLMPFIRAKPFKSALSDTWQNMLNNNQTFVDILQLSGPARDIQRLITEFILWDLYDYASTTGSVRRPLPIVLDEIQNLNHSKDSPIDKMLREGRKFGLSLILATQTLHNFDKEQQGRLFQAGHKLLFRPADGAEMHLFADLLKNADSQTPKAVWLERLSRLEKGQCYSLGPVQLADGTMRNKPVLVSITALAERDLQSANADAVS